MAESKPEVNPFERMLAFEQVVLDSVREAAQKQRATVDSNGAKLADTTIRASFLRWLLTHEVGRIAPSVHRITLVGAKVSGELDLSAQALAFSPRFVGCTFADRILLADAKVVGFEIISGELIELIADRLAAAGPVVIRKSVPRDEEIIREYQNPPVVHKQLRFNGATVGGNFDLRGCRLLGKGDAGRDPIPLFADGLVVKGNALLSDRFEAFGEIKLSGCQIGRNLDFSGAKLRNPRGNSLSVDQGRISGDALFCFPSNWSTYPEPKRFSTIGTIGLAGTRIDGSLDCSGGFFAAPIFAVRNPRIDCDDDDFRLQAIQADGMSVGDGFRLGNGMRVRGEIHLVNARVTGDLDCDGGFFDNPGRDAISADGILVTGTVFLRVGAASRRLGDRTIEIWKSAKTNGFIRFAYGELKQGLMIDGLEFRGVSGISGKLASEALEKKATCGVKAPYSVIGGSLYLKRLSLVPTARSSNVAVEIDLQQAKASEIVDDEASWQVLSHLHVGGFEYTAIRDLDSQQMWRCDLLDKHYARAWRLDEKPVSRSIHFQPQPYLRLAQVMQAAGYDAAATTIRIRLERNRTRHGDYGYVVRFFRRVFDFTIRYGYKPFRVLKFLVVWLALSTAAFEYLRGEHIVPVKRTPHQMSSQTADLVDSSAGKYDIKFSPLFFALDSLVPIVDLRQRSQYLIQPPTLAPWRKAWQDSSANPRSTPKYLLKAFEESAVPLLGIINPYLGWTLTTLFVIGVTGLVRKG